uniref:Uncharacterized protein n=1 Tax=Chenopodium quinoa TaxID=63459 RepID=A0A803LB25_CHEQI
MVVSVMASTTRGKPLAENVLHKTVKACYHAIELDSARKKDAKFRQDYSYGGCWRFGRVSEDSCLQPSESGAEKNNLAGLSTATSQIVLDMVCLIKMEVGVYAFLLLQARSWQKGIELPALAHQPCSGTQSTQFSETGTFSEFKIS